MNPLLIIFIVSLILAIGIVLGWKRYYRNPGNKKMTFGEWLVYFKDHPNIN